MARILWEGGKATAGLCAPERSGGRLADPEPPDVIGYYRRTLEAGLDGSRRRQAMIQMASSMRETGGAAEALELLEAEAERGSDEYDDAIAMCRALTLAKLGRDREGLSVALLALAPHLPRYGRSTVAYAKGLVE